MDPLAAIIFTALALVTIEPPPCTSHEPQLHDLRFARGCQYGPWSEWKTIGNEHVPTSQCSSGDVFMEQRQQVTFGGSSCKPEMQNRTICEPEMVDRIILALGLGSSRPAISERRKRQLSLSPAEPFFGTRDGPNPEVFSSCGGTAQKLCPHVTVQHRRRFFLEPLEILQPTDERHPRGTIDPKPLPFKPTPFSITEHGHRYRRQNWCSPTSTQYVLFVLDTSSSIGREEFNRLTAVLGDLILFFCSPIKVAVMTYDQEYFVEFCFNCFDGTCSGRVMAGDAMSNINYRYGRSGIRWRHTAGAAQCVCDFMLTPNCGVPAAAGCIDVVFITAGRSNDPILNICNTIGCLHDRYGVTTHAIGVGNAFTPELECISNAAPNSFNLFNFSTFDEFVQTFQDVLYRLISGGASPSGDPYVCVGTRGLGTNGCS